MEESGGGGNDGKGHPLQIHPLRELPQVVSHTQSGPGQCSLFWGIVQYRFHCLAFLHDTAKQGKSLLFTCMDLQWYCIYYMCLSGIT